ncbi:Peptidase S24-like [Sphingomonas gellani]|uniref:Peptidase S24-like n=1 Tax=Sphingomonas gellani TaxID=1166340 RepID=A0A1H8F6P1_9SPHN|nr:S24 family peptidase [Sphingomonas gellani]SEN27389.1 Peptidase S24-like [Sphingomonas gellani]
MPIHIDRSATRGTVADPRDALVAAATRRGESLTALSTMLGRNAAYLQQYVRRGTPRVLDARDRRLLAQHLGLDEVALGGTVRDAALRLPVLDIAASAGPGSLVDEEVAVGAGTLDAALARSLGLRPGQGSVIGVRGDSMEPGIMAGDQLVVNAGDRRPDAAGGVYIIRVDGVVMVKRVSGRGGALVAVSDNPAADPVPDLPIEVIGRVVWQMRRPR